MPGPGKALGGAKRGDKVISLGEKIIDSISDISRTKKIRNREKYVTCHATFDVDAFDNVLLKIKETIEPVLENGEKIENDISSGEIVDCGTRQFEILKGKFLEVYDYDKTTAIFIRLYHVKGEKEWLALYVDENPDTPWWGEDEAS
jgi:hypothetical protein